MSLLLIVTLLTALIAFLLYDKSVRKLIENQRKEIKQRDEKIKELTNKVHRTN